MSPNFLEGDFVICAKFPWSIFKQNDVVLIQHPQYGMILKKIHSQVANQSFLLIGINLSESVSTQQMGDCFQRSNHWQSVLADKTFRQIDGTF